MKLCSKSVKIGILITLKNKEKSQWFKNSKSTNNTVEESGEPIRQGRIAYGVSGLLIVALLLSTVVMLNKLWRN